MINLSKDYISSCMLWGTACANAKFKMSPADFIVKEILDWSFTGSGEHLFLCIEKTGCNTHWVIEQLAQFYKVPKRDIGYSGLKDRQAVTTQYFSIRMPGIKQNEYFLPENDEFKVLSHHLHDKKLKVGSHKFNQFIITLKFVEGDLSIIEERLSWIKAHGVPNFFDKQRFGFKNIIHLNDWITGNIRIKKHTEKNRLISVFRSIIFNYQLSQRVSDKTWDTLKEGDKAILNGTNSFFDIDVLDDSLINRCQEMDVHPAGILVGSNSDLIKEIDDNKQPQLIELFKQNRVNQSLRALRIIVNDLCWEKQDDNYVVNMKLPAGAYASGVIRQVFDCSES